MFLNKIFVGSSYLVSSNILLKNTIKFIYNIIQVLGPSFAFVVLMHSTQLSQYPLNIDKILLLFHPELFILNSCFVISPYVLVMALEFHSL